jgi:hypothetical protein
MRVISDRRAHQRISARDLPRLRGARCGDVKSAHIRTPQRLDFRAFEQSIG